MLYVPQQSQPLARTYSTSYQANAEVKPQVCFCINPEPPNTGYTWWCEIGREIWNTNIYCDIGP